MKHTEIPHELDNRKVSIFDSENKNRTLEAGDKIIYASIRRYMNSDTRECYPSIRTIKEKLHCSQGRITAGLERLEKAGFIIKNKHKAPNGKWSNYYHFPESEFDKHFEMFTDEFLDLDLPINIKEYYMDLQQYLYDKDTGVGKCSFSNNTLANKLGISAPTVKKYNTYLIEHGFLEEETTGNYDEAGLPVVQKNFNLTSLQQAALWVKAVTAQVTENTKDIETLKGTVEKQQREIEELKRQLQKNIDLPPTSYKFE